MLTGTGCSKARLRSNRTKLSDFFVVAHRRQRLFVEKANTLNGQRLVKTRATHASACLEISFVIEQVCFSRVQLWSSCAGTGGRSQEHLHASNLVDPAPGQGWRGMVNACEGE